jgi:menaquinone-specific isochorismate synthase
MRAITRALDTVPDLLAEAGEDGLLWRGEHGGIAGTGTALHIELAGGLADPRSVASVGESLASIAVDDAVNVPGTGPVAIGALPFDPTQRGHLVVPRRLVGRWGDTAWVTTIEGGESVAESARLEPGVSPDEFTLNASMTHTEWQETVARAVDAIGAGELQKVVLARRVDIGANRPFVVSEVLERLASLYPSCMIFSVERFLGASPELLICKQGDAVDSLPLAGTVARSGDAHGDEALVGSLMASPKARHEHQVVVDSIASVLAQVCTELSVPEQPTVMGLRNVSHLATHITGRLAPGLGQPSALELVARLHPTPAVGGIPTQAAILYLQKTEGFDRGCYAGPVGWVDARGDGAWALGIRSAEVNESSARIYAGNGIVAGSDPVEELAETQLKFQALLAALVRP